VNYKRKWQENLLKRLRSEREVKVETRDSRVIGYLTELQEANRIEMELITSGVWTCRLKNSQEMTT
jgi:hypothetical protein